MHTDEPQRAQALAHLRTFETRVLPGTLRRIAGWKRLGRGELPDLRAELLQELALDCLLHAAAITAMPAPQRHGRWMRLIERWVYRHRLRPRLPPATPRPTATTGDDDPGAAGRLPDVPDHWVRLGNGRHNLSASAVRDGRPLAALQSELEQLVARLGGDGERDAFWRARLAEALTGLAADLLRQRGRMLWLPERRSPPDPERRLRRIRALGRRFHVRPSTIEVRRIVRVWTARGELDATAPRRLLADAVRVWPQSPVAWLWLAEACLADGDLRGALAAVRAHRTLPQPQRGRAVLVRARVLEHRGRWQAALRLLHRASRRWPTQARLRRALLAIRA